MTFVLDATPLIYLAKVDRLDVLDALERRCIVPRRVSGEVVEVGKDRGYPDARRVERSIDTGSLAVDEAEPDALFERLTENPNLSAADAAVLALAHQVDGTAVVDEQYGRTVASAEGIPTRGTAYLLLRAVKLGGIPADDARDVVDDLVDAGWYCSTDLYAKIQRTLDEFE